MIDGNRCGRQKSENQNSRVLSVFAPQESGTKTQGPEVVGQWPSDAIDVVIRPDRSAIKPAAMEAKGIRLQGERGISRQTIAQGMPECSGCTCMLVCASIYILHTRPRVQQAPGIPCSLSLGDKVDGKTRTLSAARTPTHIPLSSPAKAHAGDPVFQRR